MFWRSFQGHNNTDSTEIARINSLKTMAEDPERYLATAAEILAAEGLTEAAEILRKSTPRVDKTGYDNWNGGTTIWTIFLLLDPAAYALISGKRKHLRTTNVIESPFATVRLRERATRGAGSRTKGLLMAFKLLDMVELRWCHFDGAELLPLVRAGVKFAGGVQVDPAKHLTQSTDNQPREAA
jgi:hypothetical protein